MSASQYQDVNNKVNCHNREVTLHCIPAMSSVASEGQGRRSHQFMTRNWKTNFVKTRLKHSIKRLQIEHVASWALRNSLLVQVKVMFSLVCVILLTGGGAQSEI